MAKNYVVIGDSVNVAPANSGVVTNLVQRSQQGQSLYPRGQVTITPLSAAQQASLGLTQKTPGSTTPAIEKVILKAVNKRISSFLR